MVVESVIYNKISRGRILLMKNIGDIFYISPNLRGG